MISMISLPIFQSSNVFDYILKGTSYQSTLTGKS